MKAQSRHARKDDPLVERKRNVCRHARCGSEVAIAGLVDRDHTCSRARCCDQARSAPNLALSGCEACVAHGESRSRDCRNETRGFVGSRRRNNGERNCLRRVLHLIAFVATTERCHEHDEHNALDRGNRSIAWLWNSKHCLHRGTEVIERENPLKQVSDHARRTCLSTKATL